MCRCDDKMDGKCNFNLMCRCNDKTDGKRNINLEPFKDEKHTLYPIKCRCDDQNDGKQIKQPRERPKIPISPYQ
jgi:hypothetical protein